MKLLKTSAATADSIPTKRSVSPEYAALTDRLTQLRDEQHSLRTEARLLDARIRSNTSLVTADTARQSRAAEILDGKPVAEQPADEARLATVIRRLGDLDAAADLLRTRIDVESRKAGTSIALPYNVGSSGTSERIGVDRRAKSRSFFGARADVWAVRGGSARGRNERKTTVSLLNSSSS